MKKVTIKILFLVFLASSLTNCSRPFNMLEKIRENKDIIQQKQVKEEELHKESFKWYKKAYQMDKSVFGKYDLLALGDMYLRFENNKNMREQLYKEAASAPIR
jgi:hypothetical protein